MWSRFVAKPVCKANGRQNKHCGRSHFHIKLSWTKSRRSAKAKLLKEHFSGVSYLGHSTNRFCRQDYTYLCCRMKVALTLSSLSSLSRWWNRWLLWIWERILWINPHGDDKIIQTKHSLSGSDPLGLDWFLVKITANFRSNWKLNFEDLEIIQLKVESRGAADRGTRMIRNFELCVCLSWQMVYFHNWNRDWTKQSVT